MDEEAKTFQAPGLPGGWSITEYDDGSGHLSAPGGRTLLGWDRLTGEVMGALAPCGDEWDPYAPDSPVAGPGLAPGRYEDVAARISALAAEDETLGGLVPAEVGRAAAACRPFALPAEAQGAQDACGRNGTRRDEVAVRLDR